MRSLRIHSGILPVDWTFGFRLLRGVAACLAAMLAVLRVANAGSAETARDHRSNRFTNAELVRPERLPNEMSRAEIYSVKLSPKPRAILVLCPGCNESGKSMVEDPVWQSFARQNNLGLIGTSYQSDMAILADWRGYHIASQGSGQVLIDGVRKVYGEDLPLLMYGVSSGALFICQFVDWKPERVLGWSAYAGGWGGDQRKQKTPPGIIACGEYDGSRYGAMLSYFKQGRAFGKPWIWLSLPKTDHEFSPPVEQFTRSYFVSVLEGKHQGQWADIDREEVVSANEAERSPSITGWLPNAALLSTWRKIHEP